VQVEKERARLAEEAAARQREDEAARRTFEQNVRAEALAARRALDQQHAAALDALEAAFAKEREQTACLAAEQQQRDRDERTAFEAQVECRASPPY